PPRKGWAERVNALLAYRDLRRVPDQEAPHVQVLLDCQDPEDPPTLRDLSNAPPHDRVRPQRAEGLALEPHVSLTRAQEPRDRVEQRGLAGAVPADQRDDLS